MPGAGLFEAAAAGVASLLDGSPAVTASLMLLARLTIPAPLLLPAGGAGAAPVLLCTIDCRSGEISLASGSRGSVQHSHCGASALQAMSSSTGPASASHFSSFLQEL